MEAVAARLAAALPAPPAGGAAVVDVRTEGAGKVCVEVRPRIAPWFKHLPVLSAVAAAVAFLGLIMAILPYDRGEPLTSGAQAAIAAFLLAGIAAWALMMAAVAVRWTNFVLLFDARTGTLFIDDSGHCLALAARDVRRAWVVAHKRLALHIHPHRPPWRAFGVGPRFALDVQTPAARLRLFGTGEAEELHWLASVLATLLDRTGLVAEGPPFAAGGPLALPTYTPEHLNRPRGPMRRMMVGGAVALSVAMLAWVYWHFVPAVRSGGWPATEGVVTSASYEPGRGRDGGRAVITYRYRVAGKEYESDRVRVGRVENAWRVKRLLIDRHPAGWPIPVRYDPKDPAIAALYVGAGWFDWVIPLMALGVVWLTARILLNRPTPEEDAVARRYGIEQDHFGLPPRSAGEPDPSALTWTVPASVIRAWRRSSYRHDLRVMLRLAVVSGVLWGVAYLLAGPLLPPRAWVVLGLLVLGIVVMFAMPYLLLLPLLRLHGGPRERRYEISDFGLRDELGGDATPWRALHSYRRLQDSFDPYWHVVELSGKDRDNTATVLIPAGELADRIIECIDLHLPEGR